MATTSISPILDYTIANNIIRTESAGSLNGRLTVKAGGNDCGTWLTSLPTEIGKFFSHAYADVRLFLRSYNSMGAGTTDREIDRRVNETTQFLTVIDRCGNNRNAVNNRFQRLSPQVRDLLFNIDQNYVNEFVQNPNRTQEIREEMLRECQRVITFQRQLTAVNTFYRMFTGSSHQPSVTTTTRATTTTSQRLPISEPGSRPSTPFPWFPGRFDDLLGGFFGGGGGRVITREELPPEIPVGLGAVTSSTTNGFNLNVPGTVAYVRNAIPAGVETKAQEINNLKVQFASLRAPPAVPATFGDVVAAEDFMSIPVFDASHPSVQTALRGGIATAISNRDFRHLLDKSSLESLIAAGSSWAPSKCHICRHPEHGGIRRENLRIDTDLQDQILQFLRTAVAAGATTT